MSAISAFFVHSASVEKFLGAGPTGDTYAPAVSVKGFLDDGVVRVSTGVSGHASGEELVQRSIFYGPLMFTHDGIRYVSFDVFTPESRVTVNGRPCQVTARRLRDGGSLGLPDHVEVDLT
jgi:hypothetical protein